MLDPHPRSTLEHGTNGNADEAEIGDRDVALALESMHTAPFKSRFIRTDCNRADPEWSSPTGAPIKDYVREQLNGFNEEIGALRVRDLHSGVFQRFEAGTSLTVAHHGALHPVAPSPRDLLHVYGPDRGATKELRFYRYAWTEEGPNAIIYSSDTQIINEGLLACNSYAYSGQSSFALAGAGMFFLPKFGDAKVSVRPYVRWATRASFTGNERTPATASAFLGIFVQSWKRSGGGQNVERDHVINVWSQNTQGYMTGVGADGTATVGDGLATDFVAVSSRKYAIFVYALLETDAAPQQAKNEQRFVTLDIDATAPFVVVEETLL